MAEPGRWRARLAEELALLPETTGRRGLGVFQHGSLRVRIYAPRQFDPQEAHDQDELYVVMSGSGRFRRGTEKVEFAPGDVLFVPAGMKHAFEGFGDDFAVWVMFYGPEGGEKT
jgi:mannose-6-phosphate isomerase-like protein (cupin superfamily)